MKPETKPEIRAGGRGGGRKAAGAASEAAPCQGSISGMKDDLSLSFIPEIDPWHAPASSRSYLLYLRLHLHISLSSPPGGGGGTLIIPPEMGIIRARTE